MGAKGLTNATKIAILNANYLRSRLQEYYNILYKGINGTSAHEFIIDCRDFKADTEIEVEEDLAKAFLFDAGVSLSDLVDAINAVGATPSDLVAILEALREAGALNAELIVI